jgi:hypothetical protein
VKTETENQKGKAENRSPFRGCVAMERNEVIPAAAGIQEFLIAKMFSFFQLDAGLRGHDELRHSLSTREGAGSGVKLEPRSCFFF